MAFRPALGPGISSQEWEDVSWANALPADQQAQVEAEQGKIALVMTDLSDCFRQRLLPSTLTRPEAPLVSGASQFVLLREALHDAVPVTEHNERLYRHLELTAQFARRIAEALRANDHDVTNPGIHAIAGMLNDVGKLTGVFRYHLNDLVGQHILESMRLRPGVTALFQPAELNIGPLDIDAIAGRDAAELRAEVAEHAQQILQRLTPDQQVHILADVCGKPAKELGTVQTFAEMEEHHMATRKSAADYEQYISEKALWPSEKYAYKHIPYFAEGWLWIYRQLRERMKTQGADVAVIREQILEHEAQV